jgi:hypothetical protein
MPDSTPAAEETTMNDTRKLVGTKKLAEILGCSQETIHNMRNDGRIKGYRFIKRWRYDVQEVLNMLQLVDPEYS